jgi:D-aspartate ligase
MEEAREMEDVVAYPAFVKGAFANLLYGAFHAKGFKVANAVELQQRFAEGFAAGVEALVQTVVEGPATKLTSVCVYCAAGSGEIVSDFVVRKVRQAPPAFGVGTMVETVSHPEVAEMGRSLCRALGYTGIAEIEFKRGLDGVPRWIEINPRLWERASLATRAGVDFPYLPYLDLTGAEIPATQGCSRGLRWGEA